jgi:hypothetical protein
MLVQTPLTVAEKATTCLDAFARCLEVVEGNQNKTDLEQQHMRFNMWAANQGVFNSNDASLDYRLKPDPGLQRLVIDRLDVLSRLAEECTCSHGIYNH